MSSLNTANLLRCPTLQHEYARSIGDSCRFWIMPKSEVDALIVSADLPGLNNNRQDGIFNAT